MKRHVLSIFLIFNLLITNKVVYSQNNKLPKELFEKVEYQLTNNNFDSLFFQELIEKYPQNDYIIGINIYFNIIHNKKSEDLNIFLSLLNKNLAKTIDTYMLLAKGAIEIAKDNRDKAGKYYLQSLEKDKKKVNKWVRLELYYYYKDLDANKALHFLNEALEIDSYFSAAQMELSNVYVQDNRINKALELVESVILRNQDPFAYLAKARINFDNKNYSEAKSNFLKSIDNVEIFEAYIGIGDIEYSSQEYKKAIEWYNKGIKYNKNNSVGYNRMGLVSIQLNLLDQAETFFQKALEVDENENNYMDIIYIKVLKQDYTTAKDILRYSVEKYGVSPDTYFWDILLFSVNGEYEFSQQKINEFYSKYDNNKIEWLKKELAAWGVEIE